jgi:hypothetical protein
MTVVTRNCALLAITQTKLSPRCPGHLTFPRVRPDTDTIRTVLIPNPGLSIVLSGMEDQ